MKKITPLLLFLLCANVVFGQFGSQHSIGTNLSFLALNHGDIDNDGDEDLIVGISQTGVWWYEQLPNGSFASIQQLNGAMEPISMEIVDIDNDGDLDIVIAGQNTGFYWYENIGSTTFTFHSFSSTYNVGQSNAVSVGDLDNDGDLDILGASENALGWIENHGNGTFAPFIPIDSTLSSSFEWYDVVPLDLDGDGDLDILASNQSWYENLGGGNFGPTQNVPSGSSSLAVNGDDVDADGDVDIIVSSSLNGLVWMENLGSGSFTNFKLITTKNADQISLVDIDNDGDNDIIISATNSNSLHGGNNSWFENIGVGGFDTTEHIIEAFNNGGHTFHTFFDKDNDGDIDVVSYNVSGFPPHPFSWHKNFLYHHTKITGRLYMDINQNGINDSSDLGMNHIIVQSSPQSDYTFTFSNGYYFMNFSDSVGTYQISPQNISNWSIVSDSLFYTIEVNILFNSRDSLDFGFYPDTLITEISSDLTGGLPRCNQNVNYWLNINNLGTTINDGVINLQLHDSLTYVGADVLPDSIVGQNIYWHYDSLFYFSNTGVNVQVLMPPFTMMGDTVTSYLVVNAIDSLSSTSFTTLDTLSQIVVCAYDPNDKKVNPQGIGNEGYMLPTNEPFEYLIRFQNTGNDTAITVVIKDQLDSKLDWNSLQFIASSYPVCINVDQSGKAEFKFENIMLPDSGVDFLGSQGFVKYKILPKLGLKPFTKIKNSAEIYFDYNPAIVTNIVVNTIYDCDTIPLFLSGTEFCLNDSLIVLVYEYDVNNYVWELDSVFSIINDTLIWATDTAGIFNLTLSISNQLCFKDTTLSIKVNSPFFASQNQSICQGDSVLIYGTYQYTSGTYYDSLQTINGCDSILSTTLTVNPLPNVTITSFNPDTICSNGSVVTLPNGSPSGGVYSGTGVSGGTFDPNISGVGIHSVIYTYTDINSCINSDSTFITVEQCVGITDFEKDLGILIYPNPNTGLFTIEKSSELDKKVNISLLDASSRVIINKIIPKGQQKIEMDITNYSKGVYYLQMTIGDKVYVKQILKN